MDYGAAAVIDQRQGAREALLGNGHDGTLRTYSRRRGHGHGIGDVTGNRGRNGKLQGVKRKSGRLESMGIGIDMNIDDGKTAEEEAKGSKKEENHLSDVGEKKKEKERKDNTCKLEAEKENKLRGLLSKGNDMSFSGVADDAGDDSKIGKRKRREKIVKKQEPGLKRIHSSRSRQRGRERKAMKEGIHTRKKADNGAQDNEVTGAIIKRTPLMKEKKKLKRNFKSEERQGSRQMEKVQKSARTRQAVSSDSNTVDSSGTDSRSKVTWDKMTVGDDEDEIAIENVEGEITDVRDQAKQNGEVDVVEAFRRHVESERKHLISLLKQAQTEEKSRHEEHAKTIIQEAANAFNSAHIFEDYEHSAENLTEQDHNSKTNLALPSMLRTHPNREHSTFLLEQSHALLSKHTAFKEKIAQFRKEDAKDIEQQLVTFMNFRKRKQEEVITVLGDLYEKADEDSRNVIEREERKMKGIGKGIRRLEKWGAEPYI